MERKLFNFDISKEYFVPSSRIYLSKYEDKLYQCTSLSGKNWLLMSTNMINNNSKLRENRYFETVVPLEDLEDIFEIELYGQYKGKIFKVVFVSGNFDKVELIRNENENTIEGFTYSEFFNDATIYLSKNDIERFFASQKSILGQVKRDVIDYERNTKTK